MKALFILNAAPYGSELTHSGLGLATGNVGVCAGCMDARALQDGELVKGTHRGTLDELADWSEWADTVFVF